MRSYNRVVLIGNLTRDPDVMSFQSGTLTANLGLAINERRKDRDGNSVEDVSFIDVSCWGRVAEIVDQYAHKGSPLLVEGRLKQETWEKDGRNFSKVKVIADRILLLGDKRDEEQGQGRDEYRERRDDGNRRYNGSGSGSGSGYRGNQGSGNGYRKNNGGGGYQSRGNGSGGYDDRRYPETEEEPIPF